MINIVEVISTAFDSAQKRLVKFYRMGKQDVQDCTQVSPAGVDSSPIKGMRAIYAQTPERGKNFVIGYLSENQLAQPGETRVFSVDSSGELKAWMWFKGDGTIEILGSDDNLVRFKKLEEGFNELKDDHNALVQKWNAFVAAYVPGSPASVGTPPTLAGSNVPASTASITGAKFDEVKTK